MTRVLAAVVVVFCLSGCGKLLTCSPTQLIRVSVDGRDFTVPVSLRPDFIGAPKGEGLPSFTYREDEGRWAYCQGASEPPVSVESFSFYPRNKGVEEVSFLIVGRLYGSERPTPSSYPMHEEAGFEVIETKGITYVFSPAGGVRPAPVSAFCAPVTDGVIRSCRISFTTQRSDKVTFDLPGAYKLSEWPKIIARVDAYVTGFRASR